MKHRPGLHHIFALLGLLALCGCAGRAMVALVPDTGGSVRVSASVCACARARETESTGSHTAHTLAVRGLARHYGRRHVVGAAAHGVRTALLRAPARAATVTGM